MKKLVFVFTASLLGCALAGGVSAQTRPYGDPGRPAGETKRDTGRADAQRQAWSPDPGHLETSKIIGTRIRTADGKDVGEIDQLVVNPSDGKITHVVLGKGGVLGIGEQKLVLAWPDVKLQHDPDKPGRWIAVVDSSKLDTAARYEARKEDTTTPAASPRTSTPPASKTK